MNNAQNQIRLDSDSKGFGFTKWGVYKVYKKIDSSNSTLNWIGNLIALRSLNDMIVVMCFLRGRFNIKEGSVAVPAGRVQVEKEEVEGDEDFSQFALESDFTQ
jgi:hypothetical protein